MLGSRCSKGIHLFINIRFIALLWVGETTELGLFIVVWGRYASMKKVTMTTHPETSYIVSSLVLVVCCVRECVVVSPRVWLVVV
jgi:hypothetical protein